MSQSHYAGWPLAKEYPTSQPSKRRSLCRDPLRLRNARRALRIVSLPQHVFGTDRPAYELIERTLEKGLLGIVGRLLGNEGREAALISTEKLMFCDDANPLQSKKGLSLNVQAPRKLIEALGEAERIARQVNWLAPESRAA